MNNQIEDMKNNLEITENKLKENQQKLQKAKNGKKITKEKLKKYQNGYLKMVTKHEKMMKEIDESKYTIEYEILKMISMKNNKN